MYMGYIHICALKLNEKNLVMPGMLHTSRFVKLDNSVTFPRLKIWVILPSLCLPWPVNKPYRFFTTICLIFVLYFQNPRTSFITSCPDDCSQTAKYSSVPSCSICYQANPLPPFFPELSSGSKALTMPFSCSQSFSGFTNAFKFQTPHVIPGVPDLSPTSFLALSSHSLFSSHAQYSSLRTCLLFSEPSPPPPPCIIAHTAASLLSDIGMMGSFHFKLHWKCACGVTTRSFGILWTIICVKLSD